MTLQPVEDTGAAIVANNLDKENMAEIPAVALEHPEASVPVPPASSSAEKVVGKIADAAEVEEEFTPQLLEDTKTPVDDTMEESILTNSRAAFAGSTLETVAFTEELVATTDVRTDAKPKLLV